VFWLNIDMINFTSTDKWTDLNICQTATALIPLVITNLVLCSFVIALWHYISVFQPCLWSRTFCDNFDCSQNLMQWFIITLLL